MIYSKPNLTLVGIVFISIFCTSCVSTKRTTYFADQKNATVASIATVPSTIIQENDILSITVSSLNANAAAIFNNPNVSAAAASTTTPGLATPFAGYVVDSSGNIQFPILGDIKCVGFTASQLRENLVKRILDKKLLVDPIVTVRFLNFKVTVLGEVSHPLVINVPNQKISLLEALGFAGDITIYGKRDRVLIVREEPNNQKTFYRVNLNTNEVFNSPYYYLKSGDVVYVEPNRARVGSSTVTNQLLPILLSGLSFAAIIIDRITR